MKTLDDILGGDPEDFFKDMDSMNLIWAVKKIMEYHEKRIKEKVNEDIERLERKMESNLSTQWKLMENEEFRNLSPKNRWIIWELVKIRENDNPKNQTEIADQYDVSNARLSQLKEKIEELGL